MTIRQIANRIIKDIKAWPEEARQFQDIGGPKTSWDEYKEQLQYEEYDSFEVFEETIESMARDEVLELSEKIIEKIYRSMYKNYYPADLDDKRSNIVTSILSHVQREAESQDIEYNKPDIDFIKYYVADLTIAAEVLEQVGPEEYLINGYSEATGSLGEQGVVNLSYLDEENGLKRITLEEFERVKQSFKAESTISVKEMGSSEIDIIDPNNDRQNAFERKIEGDNKTPLPGNKKHPPASTIRNESGTGSNQQEVSKLELKSDRTLELEAKLRKRFAPSAESQKGLRFDRTETKSLYSETMLAGIALSGIQIELGTKKFEDYVRAMIAEIGPGIKPFLKQLYTMLRYQPGFNTQGMDSLDFVDKADVEKITEGKN